MKQYKQNHNQGKYSNNYQQDYYSNSGSQHQYEDYNHYGGYSSNSKGSYNPNSPSKKYDRIQSDYHSHQSKMNTQNQGGNMIYRTIMNDDNSYNSSQKESHKYSKFRGVRHTQKQQRQAEYDFNSHYHQGFNTQGGYDHHHYNQQDHRDHGYGSFDQQQYMSKSKQASSGYMHQSYHHNEYYYEEDYYNDYQQPMNSIKTNNSGNKYHANKYYSSGGYQKHHSDRKPVRQKQNSMNTNKSYSSGSQEGRNSFGKKSSQAGNQSNSKYNETEYHQDDYTFGPSTNKNTQGYQSSQNQNTNTRISRRQYICKVCKIELIDVEKEFYPCNCKYSICYSCYYHQVENKGCKCPNCGKHYEVTRVEEYKQSRMVASDTKQTHKQHFFKKDEPKSCNHQEPIKQQIQHKLPNEPKT